MTRNASVTEKLRTNTRPRQGSAFLRTAVIGATVFLPSTLFACRTALENRPALAFFGVNHVRQNGSRMRIRRAEGADKQGTIRNRSPVLRRAAQVLLKEFQESRTQTLDQTRGLPAPAWWYMGQAWACRTGPGPPCPSRSSR
jgi:hypothetical protein